MIQPLRGEPDTLQSTIQPAIRVEAYARREDGSKKGPGYFGEVYNKDSEAFYATELPTKVFNVYGHMSMLIPVIVPTLTRAELAHLAAGGQPNWHIVEKAKAHAEARLKANKSVFAQIGEQKELPK